MWVCRISRLPFIWWTATWEDKRSIRLSIWSYRNRTYCPSCVQSPPRIISTSYTASSLVRLSVCRPGGRVIDVMHGMAPLRYIGLNYSNTSYGYTCCIILVHNVSCFLCLPPPPLTSVHLSFPRHLIAEILAWWSENNSVYCLFSETYSYSVDNGWSYDYNPKTDVYSYGRAGHDMMCLSMRNKPVGAILGAYTPQV